MIKITDLKTKGIFVVTNTSDQDEKVTIDTDEYIELKAYRLSNGEATTYVDKYIDNVAYITYNAPGNSATLFLSGDTDEQYCKDYFSTMFREEIL